MTAESESPQPSLFTILGLVEARPALYVGYPDDRRGEQLRALEALIAGYFLAVAQHQVRDPGCIAYGDFPAYLRERCGWSMTSGPIDAVRRASESDAEAWTSFWTLLREFRVSRGESLADTAPLPKSSGNGQTQMDDTT